MKNMWIYHEKFHWIFMGFNFIVIQGIKVLDTGCKISQYADDSTFILDGSQPSFFGSLYLLDTFAMISGVKVNYEKTEALWIGSCKSSEITLSSSKPILWAKDKVYALGVWFSTLEDTFVHITFSEKIDKLQSILNSWSARRLTLLGKIIIIKSLAVSQIVYLLSSLPSHQNIVHEINSILYDFLWDSKHDKIKRTGIINCDNQCSWLVWRSACRFVPAKGLFRDLSALQTRWASCSKSRSLTKWWQQSRLISHKDSRPHKFTR